MCKWKEDYKKLILSITDDQDEDFVQCLLYEGFESEERAKEITQFIKDNNIDCRGCCDIDDAQRYWSCEKLLAKATEHWEKVDDDIHYL